MNRPFFLPVRRPPNVPYGAMKAIGGAWRLQRGPKAAVRLDGGVVRGRMRGWRVLAHKFYCLDCDSAFWLGVKVLRRGCPAGVHHVVGQYEFSKLIRELFDQKL